MDDAELTEFATEFREGALGLLPISRLSPQNYSTGREPAVADLMEADWNEVGSGTPVGAWLETRREGETGTNICMCRIMSIGDEPEWIEKEGGRTTVTHHSFAAPTHWRWPEQ